MSSRSQECSFIPSSQDIKILLLGDSGVGKTAVVQSYVSNRFPGANELRNLFEPVNIIENSENALMSGKEPIKNPRIVIDTNGSELMKSKDAVILELVKHKPDVVILFYASDDAKSVERLVKFWLPAITQSGVHKPQWPYLPICICGLKFDLFDPDARFHWAEAQKHVRKSLLDSGLIVAEDLSEAALSNAPASSLRNMILEDILDSYRSIQATMMVSCASPDHPEGISGELNDLWDRVSDIVLHPVFPLFDPIEAQLTPAVIHAVARIFRILDLDGDNVLSVDEFSRYQTLVFGIRLSDDDIDAFMRTHGTEYADSAEQSVIELPSSQLALTEIGFQRMLIDHIFHMSADSVWRTLFTFGYRWGVADSENIALDPSTPPNTPNIVLPFPKSYRQCKFSTSLDSPLILSGSESGNYATTVADPLYLRQLRGTGLGFIISTFMRATDKSLLSAQDLSEIFRVFPDNESPLGRLFPSNTTHNAHGDIALSAWIHSWQALLSFDPQRALRALFLMGFSTSIPNTDSQLSFDPRLAVAVAVPPVAAGTARKASPVRRILVVGSEGSGKSSVIVHFLNGPNELRNMTANAVALAGAATGTHGEASIISSQEPVIFASGVPGATEEEISATPKLAAFRDTKAATLAILEVPEARTEEFLHPDDTSQNKPDAVIIAVDPSSVHSIQFLLKAASLVPDRTPTTVVLTQHESRRSLALAGFPIVKQICSAAESIRLQELAGSEAAQKLFGGRHVDLPKILDGLCIDDFEFGPKAKPVKSEELFKYVASVAAFPDLDNPRTGARRSKQKWAIVKKVAIGVVCVSVIAGGAYALGNFLSNKSIGSKDTSITLKK